VIPQLARLRCCPFVVRRRSADHHFNRICAMRLLCPVLNSRHAAVVIVAGLSVCAGSAAAQGTDTVTLNTVVVSATKSPVQRSELTQSVTVITGAELRARGIARVSDALQLVPGATVAQNGSYGSVTSLFLRGGESRYTKVLIDGVAVNQSGGFFDFGHLTTDNIDRIEIVRGPASVLYGADAVTGVVQIFTRRGKGPLAIDASARGGTYGTRDAELGASGASDLVAYSLAGAEHHSDGVFDFNNQYGNGTLSGLLSLLPHSSTDARISARYTDAEFHYPTDFTGAPVDTNSYRVQHRLTVGLDAGRQLATAVTGHFALGTNEVSDVTEDIATPFGETAPVHKVEPSKAYRRSAEGRLAFTLPASATLNIGAEYVREMERSSSATGAVGGPVTPQSRFKAERSNRAGYAELLGTSSGGISYTLAARMDDNSDYDAHATYRVGASVPVSPDTRIRASLSTAFNAPAFNEIRPTLYTVGSPGLSPERSRSWEAGIEQSFASGMTRVSATYFNQRFLELIQFVAGGPPDYLGSFANLTEAESNGYEAEVQIQPPGIVSASASYTVATPRVTQISSSYSGDLTVGQALLRRPTHSGTAAITIVPQRASLTFSANYVGKRPDVDFNEFPSPTVTLPAYVRVDGSASHEVWRNTTGASLSLTGRAENLLGKRYETVFHFPAPGRIILVGARYAGSL
jgi:vitamin B12 transporter